MFETAAELLQSGELDTVTFFGEVLRWEPSEGWGVVRIHRDEKSFTRAFTKGTWTGHRFPRVGDRVKAVFHEGYEVVDGPVTFRPLKLLRVRLLEPT